MTQEELKSIYLINKELEMWDKELESLREQSLMKSKQITDMPFADTGEVGDPVAELAIEIADIELIILGKKKELMLERKKILRYITNIPDSLDRQIVKHRCVDLMRWEDIAVAMGYERTTVSKRFNAFLRRLKAK